MKNGRLPHVLADTRGQVRVIKLRVDAQQPLRPTVGGFGLRQAADLAFFDQGHIIGNHPHRHAHGEESVLIVGTGVQYALRPRLRILYSLIEAGADSGVWLQLALGRDAVVVREEFFFKQAEPVELEKEVGRGPDRVGKRLIRMRLNVLIKQFVRGRKVEIVKPMECLFHRVRSQKWCCTQSS